MRTNIYGDANKRILAYFPCLNGGGGGGGQVSVIIVVYVTPTQRLSRLRNFHRI
jgi:hypothetical protein